MRKRLFTSLFISAVCLTAWAQQSYMVDKDVAVFYPANYDVQAHSPSPIFVHELVPQGAVAANWKLKPVYSTENGKSVVTINVNPDDDFYGTGEVIGDLRRNGKEVVFWNTDNYGYMKEKGKMLYQSHPFVMGVRKDGSAYGVIADNTWKSSLTTDKQIKFVSEGPAFRVIIIEKENAKEVMKALAKLSGTMEMPPLWALGYQQCRYSYNPDSRVKEIIDTMRIKKIPCDVIWMDIDYMDGFRVFTFDPKQFPNPKGLQDYAHAKNFKTVYMIDPGVKVEDGYFVYDQGKANNYFVKMPDGTNYAGRVWPGTCNFPDYTRHEVRSWWTGLTRDFVQKGVDGLWNDMNEPAVFDSKTFTMDNNAIHWGDENTNKGPHLRYHNVYG
ncbi:MAG: alpha-glucosidase, partial [Bacteroidaceae bacterium]|nr:alpha-glucosidase [Bacteroidaceae bacterium]